MNKDDVLKIINGKTYYYTDYVYYLYEQLRKKDEIIKEVREYIEKHPVDACHYILEILDKENK